MRYLRAAFGVILGFALCTGAGAQGPVLATAEQEAALDQAFEELLAAPDDLNAILKFARLSAQAGDYESAIGALERLLLMTSSLPTVRADLGIFYQRLGSSQVARAHLERALADASLPADVAARARSVLAEIDRATSRHSFAGALTLGARFQTNANSGPSSATVLASGFTVALDEQFQEQDDINAILGASFRHEYVLRTRNRAAIATEVLAYGTFHVDQDEVNNTTIELTSGLRFKPSPGTLPGLAIRPHLLANSSWQANEFHSKAYGAGVDGRLAQGGRWVFSGVAQYRRRDFNNNDERPSNDLRDGHETHLALEARYGIRPNMIGVLRGTYIDRSTKAPSLSSEDGGVLARLIVRHAAPAGLSTRSWRSNVAFGYRAVDFDRADPLVSATTAREDTEWRISAGTSAAIGRSWRAQTEISYSSVDSNLPNFERDNLGLTLTATYAF